MSALSTFHQRATAIANDRDAGAAELLAGLLPLLDEAIADGEATTREVARVVCRGQPAMASLWNACAAALMDHQYPGRFARVRAEMERAPGALVRSASAVLADVISGSAAPLVLTLSFSSSVATVLTHLARDRSFHVVCAEGRPRYEGRRLARLLAHAGAGVTLTTDAALTVYLPDATAVIVGADAVAAEYWINKVGTLGLAAAASLRGVQVFVLATRDKALSRDLARRRVPTTASPDEVWETAVAGVTRSNPYFEAVPAELATLFLTESGAVPPADLPAISERFAHDIEHLISTVII